MTIIRKGKAMKALSFVLLLMASMAFVLGGCSEATDPISTSAKMDAVGGVALAKSGGDVLSATGSCQTYCIITPEGYIIPGPKEKGGVYNTISFTAKKHGDGTYSGMFLSQMHWGPSGAEWLEKVKGEVVHLSIEGNTAKIIFLITEGSMSGNWGVIAFKDLGEGGKSAPPDLQAAWWWSASTEDLALWKAQTPQDYVDWTVPQLNPPLTWFTGWMAIDGGNVQVH